MKLTFSSPSLSLNGTFQSPSSSYEIRTIPSRFHHVICITKNNEPLAHIETHRFSRDVLKIGEVVVDFNPETQMFSASDGKEYAWILNKRNNHLELKDTNTLDASPSASYIPANNTLATLDISDSVPVDEVVATLVFVERVINSKKKDGELVKNTTLGSFTPTGTF